MEIEKLVYAEGGAELWAHVVRPSAPGPRPAVLICHAWAGQGELERAKAAKLAELGYVGIALDNYGRGQVGQSAVQCQKLMTPFVEDRAKLQRRLLAGFEAARNLPGVDATRVAAIGFCFGGLCALDLARSGAPLRGVVSFHGLLKPSGLEKKNITAKVLVLHGHDDPMATPAAVQALQTELSEAGADWQTHIYGGTLHSFTNPSANAPEAGTVYNASADARSWASMQAFLAEALQ